MSLEDNKENNEIKEEKIKENEIIKNENNNSEPEEKEEDDKIEGTKVFFVKNNKNNEIEENKDNVMGALDNKEKERNKNNKNIDCSTLVLNNDDSNNLNQLNKENSEIKKSGNNNLSQSFMQRTKSWMNNMWTNVKNYDYGKYYIFKKTEMEDCLDAHGNHIKIPKRKEPKKIIKLKEKNDEDFMKYNNLDYNKYYSNYNSNVFAGYPF